MQKSCPGCGAVVSEGTLQCDLCGTSIADVIPEYERVDESDQDRSESSVHSGSESYGSSGTRPGGESHLFCNQCGSQNPAGSNFCSSCGAKIQRMSDDDGMSGSVTSDSESNQRMNLAPPVPGGAQDSNRPKAEPGAARQVGILVGAGILIVVVWYMGSIVLSSRSEPTSNQLTSQSQGSPTDQPLPAQFLDQERSLQSQLESLSGVALDDKRRELIDLYVSANRLDRAADEAGIIAESEGSEQMWVAAANLYYDWMESRSPSERAFFARKSIAAYKQALEINPDNLDARTDMAIAYMYDPENPMLAIQETMRVLEKDSLHINANFNRAVMLLQINRKDQALEQLQKVKRIVGDPSDPVYIQADQLIKDTLGQS